MRFPLTTLLLTLSHLALCIIVFTAAHVIYGLARRIRIQRVGLFAGPTLLSFNVRGVTVSLAPLPISSYVKFQETTAPPPEDLDEHPLPTTPADTDHRRRGYLDVSPLERIALALSAPLLLFALSVALLGPHAAATAFLDTYPAFFKGALHPVAEAAPRLTQYFHFQQSAHWSDSLGLLAAKFTAINCIPLPGVMVGGAVVLELIRLLVPRVTDQPTFTRLSLPSFALFFAIILSWAVALAHALFDM